MRFFTVILLICLAGILNGCGSVRPVGYGSAAFNRCPNGSPDNICNRQNPWPHGSR